MRSRGEGTVAKLSVKRRDGSSYTRYQAAVTVGRGMDGAIRRVYGPRRALKSDANADLSNLRAQLPSGVRPERQRLDAYLRAWLEGRRLHLKERTILTYETDLEGHIIPALGHLRLHELTPAHVADLLDRLHGKHASVARKCRAVLHAAMEAAVRQERIVRNPVALTSIPHTPRAPLTRWEPRDARAFAAEAMKHRDGALYLLILATGLRAGEALGLMWDDLDDAGVLSIRRQLITVGSPRLDTPKTPKSIRKLKLGADVVDMLMRHRLTLDMEGLLVERDVPIVTPRGKPIEYLTGVLMFPAPTGAPYRLDVARHRYQAIIDAAKVPSIRIHDLRHYHLSRLIDLGFDPATVSRRAGHSRTSTTMDIYVEAFEAKLAASTVPLSDVLGRDGDATTDAQHQDAERRNASRSKGRQKPLGRGK